MQHLSTSLRLDVATDDTAMRRGPSSALTTDNATGASEEVLSMYTALGDETVTLNVGGIVHKTHYRTLARWPDTRLYGLAYQRAVNPQRETTEVFYDHDPDVFASVLNYYRYGTY